MARLIAATGAAAFLLALLVSLGRGRVSPRHAGGQAPAEGKEPAPAEFKAAGVCARCHVVSVLEWGVSGHVAAETTCRSCHGPSKEHVANERNEVKPDRLPRGAQIAKACTGCHDAGCPKTRQTVSCQQCHHVHALIDPSRRPAGQDERLAGLHRRWDRFNRHTEEGERQVRQGRWEAARKEFEAALKLIPGHHRARARLALCKRRQNPGLAGFTISSSKFDPETGLPLEVVAAGLDLPMALVPPGELDLGDDHLPDARPVHTVAVEAFYLGKTEVTQAQWRALMGSNPSAHQGQAFPDADRMPVENVSWDDCQAFLKRLNERVPGGGFRLPTEAEWEYACRAGGGVPGPERLGEFAWYRENALRGKPGGEPPAKPDAWSPRPAGTKRPNPWSLYDLQGNVSEWCSSLYRPYPFDPRDGRESPGGPGLRMLRGGHFADSAESLAPALRHSERPHRRLRWNGLRVARTVPGP